MINNIASLNITYYSNVPFPLRTDRKYTGRIARIIPFHRQRSWRLWRRYRTDRVRPFRVSGIFPKSTLRFPELILLSLLRDPYLTLHGITSDKMKLSECLLCAECDLIVDFLEFQSFDGVFLAHNSLYDEGNISVK